MAINFRENR